MRTFLTPSSAHFAVATVILMLGALSLPSRTEAAVEFSPDTPSYGDKIVAAHPHAYGEYSVRNTNVSVDDLQNMQATTKSNAKDLETLKKVVGDQARLIEELKRGSHSDSSSSNNELANLKRQVSDQNRTLDQLKRTVDDLSRKVK